MKAVVMAGGEGTRLRPLTCTTPKPMIKIMGKPVIGYIMELLIRNGFDDIAVTVRYRAEDIENYVTSFENDKINVRCVEETNVLGTAGSVRNAAKDWDEPFLVISGDCISDCELSKVMLYHKSILADTTIVCKAVEDPGEYGTVSLLRSGAVDSFCEKPDWSHASSELANTGIYVINPAVLDMIPENIQYDFAAHLFPEMMNSGKRLYGYNTTAYWCDIGDLKSYRTCLKDILSHKVNIHLPESKNGIYACSGIPDGDYDIVPPVYIGKNVTVGENSVIGPFTVLEDNTSVARNSRIKKSVIMCNTSIGSNCDTIGTVIGEKCVIKNNNVCLEGSCIGDGCLLEGSSTISNNVLVWPEKHVPYRSVLTENLRDGMTEYELICEDGICGNTFSELSCEKCCRLGESVASSSCGGKVGVGYDGTKESKALAMAVFSGLISGGSQIFDFGECFDSQMGFFVSFCSLDSGIYISASSKKTAIRLFGQYGLPLYRKYEREIESRYKRSDFRRGGNVSQGINDMSQVSEIYEGQLLSAAGDRLSGAAAEIDSPNQMIKNTADKCFYLLGCKRNKKPSFSVDYSGRSVTAKDEDGNVVTHDKLLSLCGIYEIMNNNDIAVPFNAPVCLDTIGSDKNVNVFRIGNSAMTSFDENVYQCARHSMWAFDGLALCFKIMRIMSQENKSLCELLNIVPNFCVSSKTVFSPVTLAKLASSLGIRAGADTQGLRKSIGNGFVTVTRVGAGRIIRIIAEADSMEAANEICAETEKKINGDTIDIYHQ